MQRGDLTLVGTVCLLALSCGAEEGGEYRELGEVQRPVAKASR
jgi:hypothetical protein